MEGIQQHESAAPPPEGLMYKNQLQINLAQRAFPDVSNKMKAWTDGEDASLATRFGAWFDNPNHPHIHLDDIEAQDALLRELGGPTLH